MAYNENINLFVTTDRNNADVFNAPLEKIIENIEDTRAYLNRLQAELDQLESRIQSEYTPTEQLNDLLATGIKGDKGDTGESLEYNWDGTALGVKLESESDFTYRELKGEPGDVSTEQLEEALTGYPTLEYLEEALQDYVTNSGLTTTLQDYVTNSGLTTTLQDYVTNSGLTTTLNNYPTNSNLSTTLSSYTTTAYVNNTLANYPTNSDLATQLSNYETHTGISNKLNNYVTKTNFNNAIGGMLTISQANGTYATKQELKKAGDYMGKTMINVSTEISENSAGYTYSNAKGGFADLTLHCRYLHENRYFKLIVDGVTIITNGAPESVLKKTDQYVYEIKIPFDSTFTIVHYDTVGTSYVANLQGFIYVNK